MTQEKNPQPGGQLPPKIEPPPAATKEPIEDLALQEAWLLWLTKQHDGGLEPRHYKMRGPHEQQSKQSNGS